MRKVVQYDLDGNIIKIYDSIVKAANATNAHHSAISRCCEGYEKTANGFQWRYYTGASSLEPISAKKGNKGKAVGQYTLDGILIQVYISIAEASRNTNISSSSIKQCCHNKYSTAGHYIWKFMGEDKAV